MLAPVFIQLSASLLFTEEMEISKPHIRKVVIIYLIGSGAVSEKFYDTCYAYLRNISAYHKIIFYVKSFASNLNHQFMSQLLIETFLLIIYT